MNCADWLFSNLMIKDGVALWQYDFTWHWYCNMVPPWQSGMAQGQGIQVLTKAYQLTSDRKLLKDAITASKAFLLPVEAGGALVVDSKMGESGTRNTRVLPRSNRMF